MIETKEQYQEIIDTMPPQAIGKAMYLTATIEALREVARGVVNINQKPPMGRRMFRCSHCDRETPLLVDRFLIELEKVENTVVALPDWIVEDAG